MQSFLSQSIFNAVDFSVWRFVLLAVDSIRLHNPLPAEWLLSRKKISKDWKKKLPKLKARITAAATLVRDIPDAVAILSVEGLARALVPVLQRIHSCCTT
jgi:hypothetical protein